MFLILSTILRRVNDVSSLSAILIIDAPATDGQERYDSRKGQHCCPTTATTPMRAVLHTHGRPGPFPVGDSQITLWSSQKRAVSTRHLHLPMVSPRAFLEGQILRLSIVIQSKYFTLATTSCPAKLLNTYYTPSALHHDCLACHHHKK